VPVKRLALRMVVIKRPERPFYVAVLVKPFLLPSSPRAILVPVEGPTGACPPTCAGGFVIRGALWPQTTFYPWWPRGGHTPDPACALGACEARGGQPLLI